jgi:enoyl-CoA hydratase
VLTFSVRIVTIIKQKQTTAFVSTVILEKEGFAAHIRLNRPDKLNAVHPQMVQELSSLLSDAEQDPSIRVIVLSGKGRAFSAGFDLHGGSPLAGEPADEQLRRELIEAFELILQFRNCPKPTIAAVHGYCLGSSMELTAVCDLTIAARDSQFGAPEVRYGSGIVCMILPWIVGQKSARELLLVGNQIDADKALAMGLISRIVANDQLAGEVMTIAREIALNDALAVRMTKQSLNRSQDIAGLDQALREALQTDLEIEATDTPESVEFNSILQRDGLKAALAWREHLLERTDGEGQTA